MQALKRVEVLELGLGAQLGLAAATQRHVAVAAHGALLHGAVGNAQRHKDATELLHKQTRFLGRTQVGLSHELNQRRAAAVVVDERLGRGGNAALGTAHVHHLGGILLHVDAQDADGHRVGTVLATPSRMVDVMDVDRPSALAEALARLWASASPNAQSGRSAAPRPVTSRSRWPYMAKATGPCVVWKFLAISG